MVVGSMELQLRLEGCESLKDKRQILRSLLDRARRDFNVAVAEVDDHDLWGNATIGVACVSNDAHHAESILQRVADLFDGHPEISVESALKRIERDY
ncbi:MAG TPA: DUF503 domain-containing protein [Fimbriimonadaceae bacterium]|nr:DUF503 domain-containing protein [Fimbriimonadaceae bacterium]